MRAQPRARPRPRRPADAAWDAFVHNLATTLIGIEPGKYLVIEVKGTDRYVQFAAEDDGDGGAVRAEAAGEYYLAKGEPGYTAAQRFRLEALGWTPPNLMRRDPPRAAKRRGARGNWVFITLLPADMGRLALLAVRTLRGVFGARTPKDLAYRAFRKPDVPLLVDELGIERVERDR